MVIGQSDTSSRAFLTKSGQPARRSAGSSGMHSRPRRSVHGTLSYGLDTRAPRPATPGGMLIEFPQSTTWRGGMR